MLARLDDWLERRMRGARRDWPTAAVLLAPTFAVLGLFGILPLFMSIYLSLFGGRGIHMRWVGLDNYIEALKSEEFWSSFTITVYYVVGTIPVCLILSFVVATFLFRAVRLRGLFRTVYFLPYVTSVVAAATIWRVLLDPQIGPVNSLLMRMGAERDDLWTWLLEPDSVLHLVSGGLVPSDVGPSLALCCVIAFDIWHTSGFMIVIILAGLTAIPRDLEEASVLDGASWAQRTRHVTLPLLSPTLFFLLIVGMIKAFQAFNSFYALTGDGLGPAHTTQNLTVYIFANLYMYQRLGYGAAVATLLAVAIVILTLIQWRAVGRRVHYE